MVYAVLAYQIRIIQPSAKFFFFMIVISAYIFQHSLFESPCILHFHKLVCSVVLVINEVWSGGGG